MYVLRGCALIADFFCAPIPWRFPFFFFPLSSSLDQTSRLFYKGFGLLLFVQFSARNEQWGEIIVFKREQLLPRYIPAFKENIINRRCDFFFSMRSRYFARLQVLRQMGEQDPSDRREKFQIRITEESGFLLYGGKG